MRVWLRLVGLCAATWSLAVCGGGASDGAGPQPSPQPGAWALSWSDEFDAGSQPTRMLGVDIDAVGWPQCGEVDVMEHIGREPTSIHGTLRGPGYSGSGGQGTGPDCGV